MIIENPFFSVVIPCYNSAHWLGRSIGSVLQQGFKEVEVLVIDDGGEDDTETVIQSLNDQRISYFKQKNSGPSAARNNGANHARGRFLVFLDSDDYLDLNFFQAFIDVLSDGTKDLGLCQAVQVDKAGKTLKSVSPWQREKRFGPSLAGSYVIATRLFREIGGFDDRLFFSENSDLFLRLRTRTNVLLPRIAFADTKVFIETIEITARRQKYSLKKYQSVKYFLEKHQNYFAEEPGDFVNFKRTEALCALQNGDYRVARTSIRQVLSKTPFSPKSYIQFFLFIIPKVAKNYYGV